MADGELVEFHGRAVSVSDAFWWVGGYGVGCLFESGCWWWLN